METSGHAPDHTQQRQKDSLGKFGLNHGNTLDAVPQFDGRFFGSQLATNSNYARGATLCLLRWKFEKLLPPNPRPVQRLAESNCPRRRQKQLILCVTKALWSINQPRSRTNTTPYTDGIHLTFPTRYHPHRTVPSPSPSLSLVLRVDFRQGGLLAFIYYNTYYYF